MLMASLSMQLAIYSVAWLVLGLGYRLNQRVALLWSGGWFLGAVCTLLLFLPNFPLPDYQDLVVNMLVLGTFLLLQLGLAAFTGQIVRRRYLVLMLAGMLMVEVLRWGAQSTTVARVWLFTVVVCCPLGMTQWRIMSWLRQQGQRSIGVILAMALPVQLTMALFVLRAVMVAGGVEVAAVDFRQGTSFDLLASLLFLLVLGAFNFALASLVLGSLIDQLHTLSRTDQLTGLFNRRVMMRRLDDEHARYRRSAQGYCVVMMDLDHFKQVNDTHGHAVGDQILRGLAGVLACTLRRTDTLARTGGEEFMLLLPGTPESGALVQAQRICQAVGAAPLPTHAGALAVSISLGVAEVRADDASSDAVVSRADAALYRAKAAGRNRVEGGRPEAVTAEPVLRPGSAAALGTAAGH